jgi:L-aspartate oxidase
MRDRRRTRLGADLVVIGGGAAGLYGALCAARETDVIVLSSGSLLASASALAQGGIAAAVSADDSPSLHAADTLAAGRGLSRPSAVAALTDEAPARVADLRDLGVPFDRTLGLEGGHSRRRIAHVEGAASGAHVCRVLAQHVLAHPRIQVVEGERALALWTAGGRCIGVRTDRSAISARATILATGGYAALWERTTNPPGSRGDGLLLAWRAGAALADLELVQFHPTVVATNGLLLSEALRGEGALLLDGDGRRFTDELAPRDAIAREIASRGTALLDLRPVERERFAPLMERLAGDGFDPGQAPIPVSPAAHYTMGGVVTGLDGASEVPGLYAAGEVACTGVHGANRLASNSLLECLVFSRRAVLAGLGQEDLPRRLPAPPDAARPNAVMPALRRAMWRDAGVERDAAGLRRLAAVSHPLVRVIAESALAREESRGGHFRTDFPVSDDSFAAHTVLRPGQPPAFEAWA